MTLEEAKLHMEYKFSLNGIEHIIDDIRNNWMDGTEEDGPRYQGVAVLEIGYVDIELNISTEEQISWKPGNKTPVIEYFVCVKNFDWEPDGYLEREVNVNWNADDWAEQLEKDMFDTLDQYVNERGYHYSRPNYGKFHEDKEIYEIENEMKF